ncbi:hypothetical protein VNO78_34954 [Psophocarpus tetragonolobus]|uniref:Uncharacterized protein n=1 Tax=Psophocarpus tetragonolobus TaxID=3891 RepID=A0AAN9NSB1_PSOTE
MHYRTLLRLLYIHERIFPSFVDVIIINYNLVKDHVVLLNIERSSGTFRIKPHTKAVFRFVILNGKAYSEFMLNVPRDV